MQGYSAEEAAIGEAGAWARHMPVPEAYLKQGSTIPDTALRAIKLFQLQALVDLVFDVLAKVSIIETSHHSTICGEQITWPCVNMYQIASHFIIPLTASFLCSFVELVATGEQSPVWFASHAWSTAFKETMSMLRFHARVRKLADSTTYWICTFANNQHNLGELDGNVLGTPFARAIRCTTCIGTVLLCDQKCTPQKRIWCVLEAYVTAVKCEGKLFDVAAMACGTEWHDEHLPPGPALRMASEETGNSREIAEVEHAWFPQDVALAGAAVCVQEAQASKTNDKVAILRLLAGITDDSDPPEKAAGYEAVNRAYRDLFRGSALRAIAASGDVESLQHLLQDGEDAINSMDPNGATPLYLAARNGHIACTSLLLQAKAAVDVRTNKGLTATVIAFRHGHEACARMLMGGDDFWVSRAQQTPREPSTDSDSISPS